LPLAIVDMWGGLGQPNFRDAQDTIPVLIMHGTADNIVSYYTGSPFDLDFLPVAYGADPIVKRSDTLGVPYTLHSFYGENHEPHGVSNGYFTGPPTPYWDTILTNVTNFYHSFLIPQTSEITGIDTSFVGNLELYAVDNTSGSSYCWAVTGGVIQEDRDSSIIVQWQSPGNQQITVKELNDIAASGKLKTVDVFVELSTSIPEAENSTELTVYPNPVADVLYLKGELPQDAQVAIYGVTGKQYAVNWVGNAGLDVSSLVSGVYVIAVEWEGKKVMTRFVRG